MPSASPVAARIAGDEVRSARAPRCTASRAKPQPRRCTRRSSGTPQASATSAETSRCAAAMSTSMNAVIRFVYGVVDHPVVGSRRDELVAAATLPEPGVGVLRSDGVEPVHDRGELACGPRDGRRATPTGPGRAARTSATPGAPRGRSRWAGTTRRARPAAAAASGAGGSRAACRRPWRTRAGSPAPRRRRRAPPRSRRAACARPRRRSAAGVTSPPGSTRCGARTPAGAAPRADSGGSSYAQDWQCTTLRSSTAAMTSRSTPTSCAAARASCTHMSSGSGAGSPPGCQV